ncbi:MAG TPA: hypothetical protein PKH24_00750 [Sedimentisphaerales bacterium]|jgi:hypothetical protein|nr:hypothetical protein [Sedimentisphaerales bacterium]HNU27945.1 hypothetical protein [Sedimentisphaerales bacterium]
MNVNPGNGQEEVSMDWVQRQLKAISAVEPPQSLKDRLMAGIPVAGGGQPAACCVPMWSRRARWVGVAAAVIITASVIVRFGVPTGRQGCPIADMNGAATQAYARDHNSLGASDTNLCDINSLR